MYRNLIKCLLPFFRKKLLVYILGPVWIRMFMSSGHRLVMDKLLSTEDEWNPANRWCACEGRTDTCIQTPHEDPFFIIQERGRGVRTCKSEKYLDIYFFASAVLCHIWACETVRGGFWIHETRFWAPVVSFTLPGRGHRSDRRCDVLLRDAAIVVFHIVPRVGRLRGGSVGWGGNWGRLCSLAGRGAKWWASRSFTPPVSSARVSHLVKRECTAEVTICWYVFVIQCKYQAIVGCFRFCNISS